MANTFRISLACLLVLAVLFPILSHAHEVYVLDEQTIQSALLTDSPNPFEAYFGNERSFYLWGFITFVVASTILFASFFRIFEKTLGPLFNGLKRFAHPLVRLTIALALLTHGWHGVIWGPELPLSDLFGAGASIIQIALMVLGVGVLLGFYTRFIALLLIALYAYATLHLGWYACTYVMHLGAYLFLFILGSGRWSLDARLEGIRLPAALQHFLHTLSPLAFPLLRFFLGFAIMFAAVYAKFLHSQLALEVVDRYSLTSYFPFDPLFIVLGAFIIEFLAGLMIALGIEVRWTVLFLAFWLTLAHLSMNEGWWVHIVLYGLGLAIFCHGYDRYSLEGKYLKRHEYEPVF